MEEHTFSKVACNFNKVTLFHGCFSRFLNCKNGTKSLKASHIKTNSMVSNIVKQRLSLVKP